MIVSKTFAKVRKKYALNNSYFKNAYNDMPRNPYEVFDYYQQHQELPFTYDERQGHWFYQAMCEYQKRNHIVYDQFFTPPSVAEGISKIVLELAFEQFFTPNSATILDACCGFGQLTKPLVEKGFNVSGFDVDDRFETIYTTEFNGSNFYSVSVENYVHPFEPFDYVISNPPYEQSQLVTFLQRLPYWLKDTGVAVLLLPNQFVDKTRPKTVAEAMSKFSILERFPVNEKFLRTNVSTEIVVLEKL